MSLEFAAPAGVEPADQEERDQYGDEDQIGHGGWELRVNAEVDYGRQPVRGGRVVGPFAGPCSFSIHRDVGFVMTGR